MKIFMLLLLTFSTSLLASDATVELKKGGAVTAFQKEDGFKLSKKAQKNLGVQFTTLKEGNSWIIPKSSLVTIKHSTGVYRRYEDWITLVLVQVQNHSKDLIKVSSVDLQAGDDVAISGVKFLRMTDADLNSDTVDACAH